MELVGTTLVNKYFEPDPRTELQYTGKYLKDGMVVLIGEERYREDLPLLLINNSLSNAMISNRWAKVTNFDIVQEYCPNKCCIVERTVFIAEYEDGMTAERKYLVNLFWYVKIDSVKS